MAKKAAKAPGDTAFVALMVIGGMFVGISCVLKDWRITDLENRSGWPQRRWGLMKTQKMDMGYQTMKALYQGSCGYAAEAAMSAANPGAAMTCMATPMCSCDPTCRTQLQIRCDQYRVLYYAGMGTTGVLGCCMLAAWGAVVMHYMGSKQMKETAVYVGAGTGGCAFLAVSGWTYTSDMVFKDFRTQSYYPYPRAYIGFFVAAFGSFLLVVGAAVAVSAMLRKKAAKKAAQDAQEEDESMLPGAGGMGGPAGMMMPGMMGPPGMRR